MEAGEHTFHKAAPVRTYRSSDSDGGVPRRRARSRHARSHSSDSQSYASGCGEGGATPLNGDATPHTAQRKTQRLLSSIRSYVPGQYRHGRSKYRRRRSGSAAQRSVSRITFVGEFGAGKSSVINTLLHVVSGSSPDEFTEAAPTGGALGSHVYLCSDFCRVVRARGRGRGAGRGLRSRQCVSMRSQVWPRVFVYRLATAPVSLPRVAAPCRCPVSLPTFRRRPTANASRGCLRSCGRRRARVCNSVV